MTNALVVLWGVKVSGEGGNLPIPADTLHEDTGTLDTMLSIASKWGRFSRRSNLLGTRFQWAEGVERSLTLLRRDIYSRTDLFVSAIKRDPERGYQDERTTVDASDASTVTNPKIDCVGAST
jgi:hypothetical protein